MNDTSIINVKDRMIGPGFPTYIVAELSANHHQSFEKALALIKTAREAGADAVKVQTYTPDTITIKAESDYFRHDARSIWAGKTLYELYSEAYTPWEWQPKLKDFAVSLGLDFFSTPFDFTAVDFLEEMEVPAYKIASFELVDLPLLRRIAQTGKPIIMSTGMATLPEIEEAVQAIREEGNSRLALLKCTSAYPAPPEEMNLRTIPHMAETFKVPVGLSDHTLGLAVPVAAVALGACIIEKHLTLSRQTPGPDCAFSLEPHEFKAMAEAVRVTEKAMGRVFYGSGESEAASRAFRRSLFVVKDMKKGETFTAENVRSIRPGYGLHPRHWNEVLGKRARCDLARGTPLSWDLILE